MFVMDATRAGMRLRAPSHTDHVPYLLLDTPGEEKNVAKEAVWGCSFSATTPNAQELFDAPNNQTFATG
jgi:hypothetical protein